MLINNANPYLSILIDGFRTGGRVDQSARTARAQAAAQERMLSAATGSNAVQVAISGLGSQLQSVARAVKDAGNEAARSGFGRAMSQVGAGTDPLATIRFVTAANDLAQSGSPTFAAMFSTIDDLGRQGLDAAIPLFMDTGGRLSETYGEAGVESLDTTVSSVLAADYAGSRATPGQNLASLFSVYRDLLQVSPDEDAAGDFFQSLETGLQSPLTGDQALAFLTTVTLPGAG